VAIKLVERGASVTRHVAAELLAHRRCAGHPFITQLVEVFLTPRHLAIVLEYVAGGDLLELVDARGGLPEDEARRLFQQLAVGMLYLHSLGVHGREMKLDNKLLAYPGAELAAEGGSAAARLAASAGPAAPAVGRPTLKIQDFTYSRSDQINSDPHSALGSLPFTSPEALDNSMASGPAADVWALGVALYKMSTGLYPFERPEDGAKPRAAIQAVLARIARADYALPPALSPPLRDLLARMLVRDPRERLALEDVPRHPWFLAELPPGLLEVNAGVDPEASAKQGEAALRALVVEAAAPLRTVDAEYVEDMADEILNEEEADDLLDELNLG
jgi:serine/threonine-protein kinase SRK2